MRRLQPAFALVVDGSDAKRAAATLGAGIAQAGSEARLRSSHPAVS
ncbi:hypothetical protein [Sphingomonas sp.]|nr:hypothetical protein [Sphingomonas sp.]